MKSYLIRTHKTEKIARNIEQAKNNALKLAKNENSVAIITAYNDNMVESRLVVTPDGDIHPETELNYYEMVKSGQYVYTTHHGIGPGACPKDLKGCKCLPNGKTILYFDRVLSQEELDFYDIKAEWES